MSNDLRPEDRFWNPYFAGLMLGLKCVVPNTGMAARLRDAGLLVVPAAENVVRILPPLVVEDAQIDEAAGLIERTCAGWAEAA